MAGLGILSFIRRLTPQRTQPVEGVKPGIPPVLETTTDTSPNLITEPGKERVLQPIKPNWNPQEGQETPTEVPSGENKG